MKKEELEKRISEIEVDLNKIKYAIHDGIVDVKNYLSTKPKIMWILKEVNSDEENRNLLFEFLRNPHNESSGIKKGWAGTFNSIAYSTYGIIEDLQMNEIPNIYESPKIIDSLNQIAYVNIKKVPGGSYAYYEDLSKFHQHKGDIIRKQVEYFSPEVIICACGSANEILDNMFHDILGENYQPIGKNENNPKFFDYGEKLLIYTYHPRNTRMTQHVYCDSIISVVNEWKKQKSFN